MQKNGTSPCVDWILAAGVVAAIGFSAPALANTASESHPHATSASAAAQQARKQNFRQVGTASWYGRHHKGRRTASGERFDPAELTAAHRTLPLDTRVRVTNLANGRSVEVTVNDRGPYIKGRVIDLSAHAAKVLGMTEKGLAKVLIEAVADQPRVSALN